MTWKTNLWLLKRGKGLKEDKLGRSVLTYIHTAIKSVTSEGPTILYRELYLAIVITYKKKFCKDYRCCLVTTSCSSL